MESIIRKDGKKVNVLYITDQNHQRSMNVVDHSWNFSLWWSQWRNIYPGRVNYYSKLKQGEV